MKRWDKAEDVSRVGPVGRARHRVAREYVLCAQADAARARLDQVDPAGCRAGWVPQRVIFSGSFGALGGSFMFGLGEVARSGEELDRLGLLAFTALYIACLLVVTWCTGDIARSRAPRIAAATAQWNLRAARLALRARQTVTDLPDRIAETLRNAARNRLPAAAADETDDLAMIRTPAPPGRPPTAVPILSNAPPVTGVSVAA